MPAPALNGYPSQLARMMHVLELRREGKTYKEIADRTGMKPERVPALITKSIKRVLRETAEEVRQIELSRVEVLIVALWDRALKDVQGDNPDFTRFDRVKQLLETKLKFCGAQAVVEGNQDNRVQIIVQQFTDRRPKEPVPGLQVIEMLEEIRHENSNSGSGVVAPPSPNAGVGGYGSASGEPSAPGAPEVREG